MLDMKQASYNYIGKNIERVDIHDKAYGRAQYTDDGSKLGELQIALTTSTKAHAYFNINKLDEALKAPGVHAIITGEDYPYPVGPIVADRPPIAYQKVRYFGEPIAAVIADTYEQAKYATRLLQVQYEELPIIQSPREAAKETAPLIHEQLGSYQAMVEDAHAIPETNIANKTKIRKGNMEIGWEASEVIVEDSFAFNPSDHMALEPRVATAEIGKNGQVRIESATQGPFMLGSCLVIFLILMLG